MPERKTIYTIYKDYSANGAFVGITVFAMLFLGGIIFLSYRLAEDAKRPLPSINKVIVPESKPKETTIIERTKEILPVPSPVIVETPAPAPAPAPADNSEAGTKEP